MMNKMTPRTLKGLTISSILYIVIALIAAAVAIMQNLTAAAGFSTGLPIVRDFLYGNRTAMSPPLYWLIIVALLTVVARRYDRWGTAGVVALGSVGLLFLIFGLLEPIVMEVFNPSTFDLLKAAIVTAVTAAALAMVVFGALELRRRLLCRRQSSALMPCPEMSS